MDDDGSDLAAKRTDGASQMRKWRRARWPDPPPSGLSIRWLRDASRSRSGEARIFENQPILIVEDEPLIGIELAEAVQRHGGRAIGPLPTVAETLAMLDTTPIAAAILVVQLLDRDITRSLCG